MLELRELTLVESGRALVDRVSLELLGGEIVGVAGVAGNGQRELGELIAGIRRPLARPGRSSVAKR